VRIPPRHVAGRSAGFDGRDRRQESGGLGLGLAPGGGDPRSADPLSEPSEDQCSRSYRLGTWGQPSQSAILRLAACFKEVRRNELGTLRTGRHLASVRTRYSHFLSHTCEYVGQNFSFQRAERSRTATILRSNDNATACHTVAPWRSRWRS
jgi:hypothetical protein